jgi:hypothetical protein
VTLALSEIEIVPGAIAYFDAQMLNDDARVTKSGDPVTRAGSGNQFLCYKVDGGKSFWAPLTTTWRNERLRIEAEWVTNGYGPLAIGEVFLQDGKNTYAGPNEAFVAAAVGESAFVAGRPSVSAEGVGEVLNTVAARQGQM